MRSTTRRFPYRSRVFYGYFISLWGSAIVLTLGILLWLDYQRHNHLVDKVIVQESVRLDAAANNVTYELAQAVAHLNILQQTPAVRNYVEQPTPENKAAVERLFKVFVANDDLYSQVRLLDLQGHEKVLVVGTTVPDGQGQAMGEMLYFREGMSQPPGAVFISKLDGTSLNGSMIDTKEPRLRFVTALFNEAGKRVGVLVLTMPGERLWMSLQNALTEQAGQPLLLDAEGKWHVSLGNRKVERIETQHHFAEEHPAAWKTIQGTQSGYAEDGGRVFVFTTIRPASMVAQQMPQGTTATTVSARESDWKLVSLLPAGLTGFEPYALLAEDPAPPILIILLSALVSLGVARSRADALVHIAKTRESEAQLRTILDNTLALAFLKDRDGHYLFGNRQFRELIGTDTETLKGKRDEDLFTTQDAALYRNNDLRVLKTGAPQQFEESLTTPLGKRVFISVRFPLHLPDGSLAVCGISTDITERKRNEDAMRLAAVVFENTNEGIVVTGADRRIITVNKAYSRITGYAAHEVIGRTPHVHSSGTHDDSFYRELWEVLEAAGQWQGEIWDRHRDGRILPLWENISVVKDPEGRVTNYVAVMSDISAIKEAEERLSFLAHHDSLTGLPNRLLFQSSLEQAIIEARRAQRKVAVMLLDLDRFKLVNDTLGHAAGDQLLKLVAARLRDAVRAEDTVSRLGGDEFTIILREIDHPEDLAPLAEKIIRAVERPLALRGQDVSIGVSIGISLFPDDGNTVDSLATTADTAMYRAKERGKRTFEFYATEMTVAASQRLVLENEMRDALTAGEFELYYQPQVDIVSGHLIGMEALLRWHHPTRGLLLPGQFIPVAEESGMIHSIGKWVIENGCRQAGEWQRAGLLPGPVSINVSAQQLSRDHLVELVESALDTEHLVGDAVALELEITESVLNVTMEAEQLLGSLRQKGVKIVIDDFGTGFSSLSQLRRLPADKIKIAGEFVQDIPQDENDMAIASAIISLGQSLGLPVIAEGVETQEQVDFLRERGCNIAQGFFFHRPMNARAATELFRRAATEAIHAPAR